VRRTIALFTAAGIVALTAAAWWWWKGRTQPRGQQ